MAKDKVLGTVWVSKVNLKKDGKYQFSYKTTDGRQHTRTRKLKADIEAAHKEVTALKIKNIVIPNDRTIPDYDGTVEWYLNLLGMLSKELAESSNIELRNDLKTIAQVASSVSKLYDYSSMETKVEELQSKMNEVLKLANRTK